MPETEFEKKEQAIAELKAKVAKLNEETKTIRGDASKKTKVLDKKKEQCIKEIARISGKEEEKATMVAFRCTFDQEMFLFDYGLKHGMSKSQAIIKAVEEMKKRHEKK